MIKKIIAFFLGVIMFLSILFITIAISTRTILNGTTLQTLVSSELNGEIIDDYLINDTLNTNDFEIDKYIEKEKMNEAISTLLSDYLKYYVGVESNYQASSNKLKDILKEGITKYEKDTGENVDEQALDDIINEINEELEKNKPEIDQNVSQVFQILYSKSIILIPAIIAIICGILIFVLRGRKILTHLAITLIINAIISSGLSFLISTISQADEISEKILLNISNQFSKISIICIVVAIISIIINVIIKKLEKKEPNIQNQEVNNNQEIINNDNNIQ